MPSKTTPGQGYPLGDVLDLLQQWWALNHAFEGVSKRMQARLGVTAQQRFVVRVIGRYPGITPGQLARVLHLDPGSISATVRRLEAARIVERRKAADDGRSVALSLTARGRRIDASDAHTVEGALGRAVERLSRRQLEVVKSFLSTFVEELDRTGRPPP